MTSLPPSRLPALDAVIVGAGPAGLSAALILGRCRRRVLVCGSGPQRNLLASHLHGYLTRDGITPAEFLHRARMDLEPYQSVELRDAEVVEARRIGAGFAVRLKGGERFEARRLLLATGVVDDIPPLEGIESLYGRSVFHCPYCDGWELRDRPLAVYGQPGHAALLAMTLRVWSGDLVVCTGGASPEAEHSALLARHGIAVREEPIARLEGSNGQLERIVFANGEGLAREALFFSTGQRQHSPLAAQLGCSFNRKGVVKTGRCEATNVPGLYVAGDASEATQFVIVAAAEGAMAASDINESLEEEDRIDPA